VTSKNRELSLPDPVDDGLGVQDGTIFGPAFFLRQLAAFVRAHCPDSAESLPSVEICLHDGSLLDLCHVVGLAPHWVALAIREPGPPSRGHVMRVELVPFASIQRVTIRAGRSEGPHVGFNQAQPPAILDPSNHDSSPEALLRSAGTPSTVGPVHGLTKMAPTSQSATESVRERSSRRRGRGKS
jgi:hypothetical protein